MTAIYILYYLGSNYYQPGYGEFGHSGFSSPLGFAFFRNISKQPVVAELRDNIFYRDGRKKYDR